VAFPVLMKTKSAKTIFLDSKYKPKKKWSETRGLIKI
jgi:hypothetical protein